MSIAYIFNKGRLPRLKGALKGEAPKEFFLGALELQEKGHEIGFFEVDDDRPPRILGGFINWLLLKGYMPTRTSGNILEEIWPLKKSLNQYDIIIGTTTGIAFALGIFKNLRLIKIPLVAIHCGLLNHPYRLARRKLTYALLCSMHTILYGEGEQAPLLSLFPRLTSKLTVIQFGVDTVFWRPNSIQDGDEYILSVGNDGRRDYDTLIETAKELDTKVIIVTKLKLPSTLPPNVEVIQGSWHKDGLTDDELRNLYQKSMCVIVPLKPTFQPSGQSVCLQAMACGKPVILTETQGMWDKQFLRHRENLYLTKPADISGIRDAVLTLTADRNLRDHIGKAARKHVITNSAIGMFADRLEKLCLENS